MKTEAYFEEYNQFITNQRKAIKELEQQRNDLQAKIKADKDEYKQLVANGEDDKVDKLYQTTDTEEKQLKAINKRLTTKQEVFDETRKEKAIELIKHQSELPKLYENEKQELIAKFEPIIEQYNDIIDEINDLNERYTEEFERYAIPYRRENFDEDAQIRSDLRPHFREYAPMYYVSNSELPIIGTNQKMKFIKEIKNG
ncbi:pathogenicity island protein [Staphylococcus epidermidis]|uniref:pathogenicity island protein n=1 Tax=Staphylococcus epidermidis TaxID=1282 RepID=UPI001D1554E4|nr:pathogenicity island protein [Staphylococcus epidermidis]MCC3673815.1 pathogenicity island protein [Staphylococcus epidermidis]MCC3700592.1 pathogenicity island protein [Staphylococcus epidermidis]MCG1077699.1 pathogenicity island protein [Staphylococcus epidermidis]MCG1149533.1 pathogenicity island protein [Staphylococcus epidermidis]MCG1151960.1 pathogenicity island protein [Staphylococcus epidermidis]